MRSPERVLSLLFEKRIPQQALAIAAEVNTQSLSLYLRGAIPLSEAKRERIEFAVQAFLEICDESLTPVDFRRFPELAPLVAAKVESYRRARTAELRRRFDAGEQVDEALALGEDCHEAEPS
jgi:hypothetical protein